MNTFLKSRIVKLGNLLLVFLILWVLGFFIFLSYQSEDTFDLKKVDAVVVLTGGKDRIPLGFKIFKESNAKLLLISGVGKTVGINNFRNYLKDNSIDPKDVILGKMATNTIENGTEIILFHKLHNVDKILVVTSSYHLLRTKITFFMQTLGFSKLKIFYYPINNDMMKKALSKYIYLTFLEYNKSIAFIISYSFEVFSNWIISMVFKFA